MGSLKYCKSCHIEDERGISARKISVSFSQKSSSFEPQKIAGQMCSTAMSRGSKELLVLVQVLLYSSVDPFDSSPGATDVFVVLVLGLDDFSWLAPDPARRYLIC